MVHALCESQRKETLGPGFDALMADGGWRMAGGLWLVAEGLPSGREREEDICLSVHDHEQRMDV